VPLSRSRRFTGRGWRRSWWRNRRDCRRGRCGRSSGKLGYWRTHPRTTWESGPD